MNDKRLPLRIRREMERVEDERQMNRLAQHARWLLLFGHLRRGYNG